MTSWAYEEGSNARSIEIETSKREASAKEPPFFHRPFSPRRPAQAMQAQHEEGRAAAAPSPPARTIPRKQALRTSRASATAWRWASWRKSTPSSSSSSSKPRSEYSSWWSSSLSSSVAALLRSSSGARPICIIEQQPREPQLKASARRPRAGAPGQTAAATSWAACRIRARKTADVCRGTDLRGAGNLSANAPAGSAFWFAGTLQVCIQWE